MKLLSARESTKQEGSFALEHLLFLYLISFFPSSSPAFLLESKEEAKKENTDDKKWALEAKDEGDDEEGKKQRR